MAQDQKITRDQRGQEQPTDKKRDQQSSLQGPAAYAPNSDEGLEEAKKSKPPGTKADRAKPSSSESGDERTPDQPIGEVAYAHRDPPWKKTGEF
jgi:hypothetical protein